MMKYKYEKSTLSIEMSGFDSILKKEISRQTKNERTNKEIT